MKEATGELNMTVITVVAIAAVGAFFYAFIWPAIRTNLLSQTRCSAAVQCNCDDATNTCECHYYLDDGTISDDTIVCDNDSSHGRG